MALTYITQTTRARVSAASTTLAVTVGNNDALLVCNAAIYSTDAGGTCAVSDSVNGAWTQAITKKDADDNCQLYQHYFESADAGGITVTVNPSGSGSADIDFTISEITGAALSGSLDNTASANGTIPDSAPYTATVATGVLDQAAEIVIGMYSHTTINHTLTAGTGYTLIAENEDNGSGQAYNAQYKIVSSTASSNCAWAQQTVVAAAATWFCLCATYKEAAAGGTILRQIMQHHGG